MMDIGIPKTAPGPHPKAGALIEAARRPDLPEHREILDHAALCADCSEELVHVERFLAGPSSARRTIRREWARFGSESRPVRRSMPSWVPALLAAAVVLAFAVPWVIRRAAPDVERGAPPAIRLLSPTGDIAAAPSVFTFDAPAGRRVRVTVFDADRTFEWTSAPVDGRAEMPSSRRASLQAGREYFWTLLDAGTTTPVARFQIVPR